MYDRSTPHVKFPWMVKLVECVEFVLVPSVVVRGRPESRFIPSSSILLGAPGSKILPIREMYADILWPDRTKV